MGRCRCWGTVLQLLGPLDCIGIHEKPRYNWRGCLGCPVCQEVFPKIQRIQGNIANAWSNWHCSTVAACNVESILFVPSRHIFPATHPKVHELNGQKWLMPKHGPVGRATFPFRPSMIRVFWIVCLNSSLHVQTWMYKYWKVSCYIWHCYDSWHRIFVLLTCYDFSNLISLF